MFQTKKHLKFLLSVSGAISAAAVAPHDWEDLVPGTTYNVPDTDISQGVPFEATCFDWIPVGGTCAGFSMVVNTAGFPADCPDMGNNVMMYNNINHVFDYSRNGPVENPAYPFVYMGGNLNFELHGSSYNVPGILATNGKVMGNCKVTLEKLYVGAGVTCGYMLFNECEIEKLMVGGQEFFWDGAFNI